MQLISIIVPVYNVEKYIVKCVDSLINQSYTDIEIILVDDGSTDTSGDLCDQLQKRDSRIVVLHKTNGGLSDARNYGLEHARGKLFLFIDSDDYIHCDMVAIMYEQLRKDNSDLVICDLKMVDVQGNSLQGNIESTFNKEVLTSDEALDRICADSGWRFVVAVNKLYTYNAWNNVQFPKGKLHEDEFIIHEVFANSSRISVIPQKLYYYVRRSGSIMDNLSDRNRLDATEAYLNRTEFFLARNKVENASFTFHTALNRMLMNVKYTELNREKDILLWMYSLYSQNKNLLKHKKDRVKLYVLRYCKNLYRSSMVIKKMLGK